MNKPASTVAKLALINARRYSDEKDKDYSRLRISKNTLRKLSGRKNIRDTYIDELTEEFAKLGWHFFEHTDTEYGMLKSEKVNVWSKISATRVLNLIKKLESGEEDVIDTEYEKLFGVDDDLSSSEGE